MDSDLSSAVANLKENDALEIVKNRLDKGDDALKIFDDARAGIVTVGERYNDGKYFIPELVYSGEILKNIAEMVKPKIKAEQTDRYQGKIIIGTVKRDIHDIGKNLVVFLLDANGYDVYDIGVDVSEQQFVDKIKDTGAGIVALSGFLTLSIDSMKDTVEAIRAAGLRDQVKIMIGGGVLDESATGYIGADAFGRFASDAVTIANNWAGGKSK